MTTINQKPQIQIKRVYQYDIHTLWMALTSKEALSEWLMPTTNFELKEGHSFQFTAKPQGNFDGIVNCKIHSYSAPNTIVYSWSGGGMKTPTIVTWELKELTPTETSLTLSHSGFTGFSGWVTKQILNMGWKKILSKKLAFYLNMPQNKLAL